MSSFPNGLSSLMVRNLPIIQTHPGTIFWVSNATTLNNGSQRGGSDGNRGGYDSPFGTLAYAISRCVANRGDIIFVKPGHAETISSATALAASIAGVAIVGLGSGSNRPTFTFSTANTATIAVSADNISFQNCIFVANFLSIASAFLLTTAKNFTLQNCLFLDTSSILDFLNIVKSTGIANTVDGLALIGCQWASLGTTSVNTMVLSANDIDRMTLQDNIVVQNTTVDAPMYAIATAGVFTNMLAENNRGYRKNTATSNGSMLNMGGTVANSTGFIARNYIQTRTTSADALTPASTGFAFFENRVSGVPNATGFVIPAVDS